MGTAALHGQQWDRTLQGWAMLPEPMHRPLWEAKLDTTQTHSGTRFLDAGCGGGGATVLATEYGAEVGGVDAVDTLIRFDRSRAPDGDFRVGDSESLL